jgi:hypothetical protein
MGYAPLRSSTEPSDGSGSLHGMVVTDGRVADPRGPAEPEPRIAAFIWGGKVRPSPTLPFGRWKGAA